MTTSSPLDLRQRPSRRARCGDRPRRPLAAWPVRRRTSSAAGHLPGAVFVDLDADLAVRPGAGGRHPLPSPEAFAPPMRRCGVQDRTAGRRVRRLGGLAAAGPGGCCATSATSRCGCSTAGWRGLDRRGRCARDRHRTTAGPGDFTGRARRHARRVRGRDRRRRRSSSTRGPRSASAASTSRWTRSPGTSPVR